MVPSSTQPLPDRVARTIGRAGSWLPTSSSAAVSTASPVATRDRIAFCASLPNAAIAGAAATSVACSGSGASAQRQLFDFPSTLFTLHDYYDTWNQWLREEGRPEIAASRIRELQERQIDAFFGHLAKLSRSEIGLASVSELNLTLAELGALFEQQFRSMTPDELRSELGLAG